MTRIIEFPQASQVDREQINDDFLAWLKVHKPSDNKLAVVEQFIKEKYSGRVFSEIEKIALKAMLIKFVQDNQPVPTNILQGNFERS